MTDRLQRLAGPLGPWISHPARSALFCTLGWLLLLPFCLPHWPMAALSWFAIWGLLLALHQERPLLGVLPLPPVTVLSLGIALRCGIGPLLLAISGGDDDSFLSVWIRYGPQAQQLWLWFMAALLALGLFLGRVTVAGASRLPAGPLLQALRLPDYARSRRQLAAVAVVLSVYMACYVLLSVLSGAFDRQFDVYSAWTHALWRLDTPVVAVSRLRDLWFLLFPLWWALLHPRWRWLLGSLLLAFLAAAILSGSRGLLFYPAALMLVGLWLVISDFRWLRRFALLLVSLVLVLSPLLVSMRESPAFERAAGWQGRVAVLAQLISRPAPMLQKARWLGRDLYACHDPFLFNPQNSSMPRVGAAGLERLPYLWVPRHLMPDRPVIFDGHLIAKQLQRIQPSAWSRVWFPCVSLPGDLFRRWGWPGVVLGSMVIASLVQVLIRFWMTAIQMPGNTFQLLLLFYPATYLQSFPFGTVSETCWALFWELPKYLILLWALGFVLDRWLDRSSVQS